MARGLLLALLLASAACCMAVSCPACDKGNPCDQLGCSDGEKCVACGCEAQCVAATTSNNDIIEVPDASSDLQAGDPVMMTTALPVLTTTSVKDAPAEHPVPLMVRRTSAADYPSPCPDGSAPANCLIDPCKANPCAPDEDCSSDYCGGCNRVCTKRVPTDQDCPPDQPAVDCQPHPCAATSCPVGHICRANFCGACSASCERWDIGSPDYYTTTGAPGDEAYPQPVPIFKPINYGSTAPGSTEPDTGCPPGVPSVRCLADPCTNVVCKKGTTCVADYCGGCNHRCVRSSKQQRPPGCPVDPCKRVHCEPSAYKSVCQADDESCAFKCVALPPPACRPGSAFNPVLKRCTKCPRGSVASPGSTVCAQCAADHYATKDATGCEPCPPGTGTDGRRGQSKCVAINAKPPRTHG